MSRVKLSWFLLFLASLIWATVFFQLSAFAAGEQPQQYVWTAQTQPIPGSAQVIEMKPTMLAPKGAPAPALRTLLTRVLGKSLGGLVGSAGIVYNVIDLEGQRQSVAYAYEQLQKNGQPVTIQMVHEWIAAQNGIDTSPSPADGMSNGQITFGGTVYQTANVGCSQCWRPSTAPWLHYGPYESPNTTGYHLLAQYLSPGHWSVGGGYYYYWMCTEVGPAPGGFDPTNYPEIFGPEFFPSQAIDALVAQGLDS